MPRFTLPQKSCFIIESSIFTNHHSFFAFRAPPQRGHLSWHLPWHPLSWCGYMTVTVGRTSPIAGDSHRKRAARKQAAVLPANVALSAALAPPMIVAAPPPCRVVEAQPHHRPQPVHSTHPPRGCERLDVPCELFPQREPCISLACEVVEEMLALKRHEWIVRHVAAGRASPDTVLVALDPSALMPSLQMPTWPLLAPLPPPAGLHPATGAPTAEQAAALHAHAELALASPPDDDGDCDDVDDDDGIDDDDGAAPSQRRGQLPADHAMSCGCGCGGISAESLKRATAPRTRPPVSAYLPSSALASFLLPPSDDDEELLNAAIAEAEAMRPDDQMVLENGCGPARVRLLEKPHYASCTRESAALCYGAEGLATYGAGEFQLAEFESMRPMPVSWYKLGVAKWRKAHHRLGPKSQECPPDLCMAQRYEAWRGKRGAFMDMHTDMRPTYEGQAVASRGDVMGVSAGADMNFWYGASRGGAHIAKERHAVRLCHGETWIWVHADDMTHKHGVWFPRNAPCDGVRWAFMFRWSNGRKRLFEHTYPHRLVMTDAERERVAKRCADSAVRAARWASPPAPTHLMSKRLCVRGDSEGNM